MPTKWTAACLQVFTTLVRDVKSRDEVRHLMDSKLDHVEKLLGELVADDKIKLVILPEFFLSGSPQGQTTEEWMDRVALPFDSPQIDRFRNWASKHKIYLGANAYTTQAQFPGRFFNTSFLLKPNGDTALTAYRIHTGIGISPHDMLKEFLDKMGLEGLFPVAKTELGNISMVTSTDIAWTEVTRAHVLRGAEVILHCVSESPILKKKMEPVRRTRAVENMAYLVSCNTAGSMFAASYGQGPTGEAPATSKIFDMDGEIIAAAQEGESSCRAELDLDALRKRRSEPSGLNFLASLRVETFAPLYAATSIYPPNTWRAGEVNYTGGSGKRTAEGVANMRKAGFFPE